MNKERASEREEEPIQLGAMIRGEEIRRRKVQARSGVEERSM